MRRVIYSSHAHPIEQGELQRLLRFSQNWNEEFGITGLLIYYPADEFHPATFLQALEGELHDLEDVYAKISQDNRHEKLVLLANDEVRSRWFGEWSMDLRYLTTDDLRRALPGFTSANAFDAQDTKWIADASVAESLLNLYIT